MIETINTPFSDEESLGSLNSYVRAWFTKNFKELSPPEKFAFKLISEKKNVLITAPTGSGKTLSGFLSIISKLFDYSIEGKLEDRIYCIYVSPLKALNNDIYKNLLVPLDGIYKEIDAQNSGKNFKRVTVGVRTGDTTQQERRKQLLHPPHIFITTPESLAIILNSKKFSENIANVEYVIIDELHELANNKRGVHLSLSLERLQHKIDKEITRVGLGATLYPMEEAAKFLVGYKWDKPRDCIIIDASWSKRIDAKVISPVKDMINTTEEKIEKATYDEINRIIKNGKTTLIFTNTRSGTERVVFNLKKKFKYNEDIAAHHGSLSRDSRLEVEDLLKKGALKCVVSSTSLELGVDIGTIDNVILLGSPKSITRAIQRIGRAGHSFKAVAKGEMIVLNRDDLVECSVMLAEAKNKRLDSFHIPMNALDVLAQHIIGMAIEKKWDVNEAYGVVKHAYPYYNLDKSDFISLLNYLSGKYVSLESRRVYGKIWYDENTNTFGKRGALLNVIYMLNLGTIPDEVAVNVFNGKKWVGSIEEEFLTKLKPGDIFTLGGRLYEFKYAKNMKCYVEPAKSNMPTIPPWYSEQLPLSFELAKRIGEFRLEFSKVVKKSIKKYKGFPENIDVESKKYLEKLPVDSKAMNAIFLYFAEQLLFAKEVPTSKLLLVEQTEDFIDKDKHYLIFHSLFGRRVNDVLSRIFGIIISESFGEDVSLLVNDNGFLITTNRRIPLTEKEFKSIINEATTTDIRSLLRRNIKNTEMMKRRFRHVAARSFMILRNYKGWKISVNKQQINSQLLLKAVEEIDRDFPVLKETYREIFNDVMDLPNAEEVLANIRKGDIKTKLIRTSLPSPFSQGIITFGHADVLMIKEKRDYLKKLHELVMEQIESEYNDD
ncbi:MAG: ATP-dependent helicase [Candidatus Micrarchaeia archaeon]